MNFGCLKSKFDKRDILMMSFLEDKPAPFEYECRMSPVKSQGREGSCTGFAGVAMKEWQEIQDYDLVGTQYVDLSERYLYNEAKKLYWGSRWKQKEGADLRSIVKVLSKHGVCEESFAPYKPKKFTSYKQGYADNAEKFRIATYARITSLNELKQSIYQFGPCIIGVLVYKSIKKTKDDGIVPDPAMWMPSNWRPLGGHAICACGYDDDKELVKFKNSWGPKWGYEGYGYLSYDYVRRHMLDAFSTVDFLDANPLRISSLADDYRKVAWT